MMLRKIQLIFGIFCLFSMFPIFSQHTILLRNGKKISGNIKDQNINYIVIHSEKNGLIQRLAKKNIRKITFSYKKREKHKGSQASLQRRPTRRTHKKSTRSWKNTEKSLMRIRQLQEKQKKLRIEEERRRNLQLLFKEKNRLEQRQTTEKQKETESIEEEEYYEQEEVEKMLTQYNKKKIGKKTPLKK